MSLADEQISLIPYQGPTIANHTFILLVALFTSVYTSKIYYIKSETEAIWWDVNISQAKVHLYHTKQIDRASYDVLVF